MVLATDDYASIGTALRGFRSQGHPARLQIVIAAMNGAVLGLDAPELDGFPHVTIVNADARAGLNIGRAEAAVVSATTAPFVVFAEGCAYPGRGFVDAIVAASASGKGDVIGAVLENANPDSATSWAAMRINYGRWLDDATPGVVTDVAGHNSAYRREAVLSLGDELADVMQSLTAVQQELRARGGVVYLETSARVRILNVSRPGWYLVDQFGKGRQFATHRCRRWPWLRRLAYAAGTPLVPPCVSRASPSRFEGRASRATCGRGASPDGDGGPCRECGWRVRGLHRQGARQHRVLREEPAPCQVRARIRSRPRRPA